MNAKRIRPREKDTITQALNAGVVPRLGLQHVQVGRVNEVSAMIRDVERIADGGACFRAIIGEYGSGKTFFLNLVRLVALEKGLVVASADLAPDRRLHATGGQARALYAELMRNLSTRTKPDGGALPSMVERFVTKAVQDAAERGTPVEDFIRRKLAPIQELVSGYDFADVITAYWRGLEDGDETIRSSALRWLRGEFGTKTEARQALGVRSIIDDADVYDQLKLMARFSVEAGYGGLLITIDEMVNLYKLQSSQARKSNYEQILRMINDVVQIGDGRLGILLGGTPEFLMDTRRGLFSYEALQGRLAENRFATGGLVDLTGPVIRLPALTREELFVLLTNIRAVFSLGDAEAYLVPDEALHAFMQHCEQKIGEAYFRTPRSTVKAFVNLLSVLEQNPGTSWTDLLEQVSVDDESAMARSEAAVDAEDDNDLTSLRL